MAEMNKLPDEPLRLREEFPAISTSLWEAAIAADLNGIERESLIWKPEEGIAVQPYYRAESIEHLTEITSTVPGGFPYLRGNGSGSWQIAEPGSTPPEGAIRGDLFHEQGANTIQELGFSIAAGVDRLSELMEQGKTADDAAGSLWFVYSIGSNFFFEIAKLRAARFLWAHAVSAFGPQRTESCLMRIYARTAIANKSIYDRYTNLLRATTEALAAAIGGVDVLEVRPFGFSDHLAVNVGRILKEECHFDSVADPAGGSYYIEAVTDALAREGWALFQQLERAGGFSAAHHLVETAVAQSRAAKANDLAHRHRTMVGVNSYPDLGETVSAEFSIPEGWRMAQPFEQIRLRTEAYARRTGHRPKVLLVEHGELKMRQARAQFCQNLFGCGGFEIVRSSSWQEPEAALIVLCSSDAEYVGLAAKVCAAVKQPVLVAGNPKAQKEALQAVGVAGYVHARSNAIEVLSEWQERLGVNA